MTNVVVLAKRRAWVELKKRLSRSVPLTAPKDDPRRDCPWKCMIGDPKCVCAHHGDPGQAVRTA